MESSDVTVVRLVIRLIRSFQHKNIRSIVLSSSDDKFDLGNTTVEELMNLVRNKITADCKISPPLLPPFKTHNFDCMKVRRGRRASPNIDKQKNNHV